MVEHPVPRRPPVVLGVVRAGQLGGVGAQQVVKGETAGDALGDQVRPGQLGQRGPDLLPGHPGQGGHGRRAYIRAIVQAQEPEQPPGRGAEPQVRPGEDGPHVGGLILAAERVQRTAGLAQLGSERGQAERRMGRRPRRHEHQSQRQPGAEGDDVVGGRQLGQYPALADPAGEQLPRLGGTQQVQVHRVGALGDDQAAQLITAGHDDQAARRAGQQRPNLVFFGRVVQQDQHPPPGEQASVQRRLGLQAERNLLRRDPEGVQEPPDRLGRGHGGAGRVEAPQVHVQLPVRVTVADPVGPVHGQGGLADAGRPGDHRDDDGRPWVIAGHEGV